jgi:hypothetical protein
MPANLAIGTAAMTSLYKSYKNSLVLRLVALAALAAILAVFISAIFSRWSVSKEADARTLLLIQDVFAADKTSSLLLFAHPDLFITASELEWPRTIYSLRRRLGKLASIDALSSTITLPLLDRGRGNVRASYEARVTFETGPAEISVDYVLSDNELLVTEFSVLSGALSR